MTFPTEAVTLAGSGLVFVNSYDANVTDAYRNAVITAENFLQSHFTDQVTASVNFALQPLGGSFSAQNSFSETAVSYAAFAAALRGHATTADDVLAVNGLPLTDPSNGAGFSLATTQARILGLAVQTNSVDDTVTLNSDLPFTFGQDAVGALEHEITEGVFGRTASLGFAQHRYSPLDLFRFTASGQRDYTGGSDGVATFFGVDGAHVTTLQYHSSISAAGVNDGFDLGDWDHTRGDSFGPGGPSSPGGISATDLQVLDVLGWSSTPFVPAPDEFASSGAAQPFGALAIGGTATGVLQQAGDHDWFAVTLQAGASYSFTLSGRAGGGGTLADPFLRLHDAAGNVLASNDDITSGSNPDSRLAFTAPASGTYYVDAGGFVDGYAGSYRVGVTQTAGAAIPPGQVIVGAAGGDTIQGPETNDTITGGSGGPNYLRGNGGNDSIQGGAAFDDINGNKGNDTIDGGSGGGDWLVGGQGDDLITAHAGDGLLYGNLGADTLIGSDGADFLRGGQGDDSLSGGAGNDFISGDRGNDTETGGAGADLFHGSQDAGIDRVLDFNLGEGDRVMLDPGTTYTVSQVASDTVIDMGAGNQMILVGVQLSALTPGWIFGA
jgi:Ca2+-binding RTX toxin-like protein